MRETSYLRPLRNGMLLVAATAAAGIFLVSPPEAKGGRAQAYPAVDLQTPAQPEASPHRR